MWRLRWDISKNANGQFFLGHLVESDWSKPFESSGINYSLVFCHLYSLNIKMFTKFLIVWHYNTHMTSFLITCDLHIGSFYIQVISRWCQYFAQLIKRNHAVSIVTGVSHSWCTQAMFTFCFVFGHFPCSLPTSSLSHQTPPPPRYSSSLSAN